MRLIGSGGGSCTSEFRLVAAAGLEPATVAL